MTNVFSSVSVYNMFFSRHKKNPDNQPSDNQDKSTARAGIAFPHIYTHFQGIHHGPGISDERNLYMMQERHLKG